MNWHNIGPFTAFFLENILFCGYAVLAAVSTFAVHKLLVVEETGQKHNRQPVYFQRTLLNKSQQKISILLFFLSIAGIVLYQPASFTVNSLLSRFCEFSVFTLGSDNWENFIVFLILPLCTFSFLCSIGTIVWLGKLIARLKNELLLEKRQYRAAIITAVVLWSGILLMTAALLVLMSCYGK